MLSFIRRVMEMVRDREPPYCPPKLSGVYSDSLSAVHFVV